MILVTGSSGFVGQAVVKKLLASGFDVRQLTRNRDYVTSSSLMFVDAIGNSTNWDSILEGVTGVIHCAARAHQMDDRVEAAAKYRELNYYGTRKLVDACLENGVERFVFVSTIKVCGEFTEVGSPFSPSDIIAPTDDYARTKAEAENYIVSKLSGSQLEYVIVRPPLVYGPGAKGNLRSLCKFVASGYPFPIGAVKSRRSFVGLNNLADFLCLTLTHPKASGGVFHVSDGKSLSIGEVVRAIARAMNRKIIVLPVPVFVLKAIGRISGKSASVDRIISSLEVDSTSCFDELDWTPPDTAEESVASLVAIPTIRSD